GEEGRLRRARLLAQGLEALRTGALLRTRLLPLGLRRRRARRPPLEDPPRSPRGSTQGSVTAQGGAVAFSVPGCPARSDASARARTPVPPATSAGTLRASGPAPPSRRDTSCTPR